MQPGKVSLSAALCTWYFIMNLESYSWKYDSSQMSLHCLISTVGGVQTEQVWEQFESWVSCVCDSLRRRHSSFCCSRWNDDCRNEMRKRDDRIERGREDGSVRSGVVINAFHICQWQKYVPIMWYLSWDLTTVHTKAMSQEVSIIHIFRGFHTYGKSSANVTQNVQSIQILLTPFGHSEMRSEIWCVYAEMEVLWNWLLLLCN